MPKPDSPSLSGGRPVSGARPRPHWLVAVGCFLLGTLLTVAFAGYSPDQTTAVTTNPTGVNPVGSFGAYATWLAFFSLGIGAFWLPVFLFWLTYVAVRNARHVTVTRLVAMAVCLMAFSGLATPLQGFLGLSPQTFPNGAGGEIGKLLYRSILRDFLGVFGAVFLLGAIYGSSLVFIFTRDVGAEIDRLVGQFAAWRQARAQRRAAAPLLGKGRGAEADARRKSDEQARPPLVLTPVGPANKNVLVPKTQETAVSRKGAAKADAPSAAKIELNIVKPEETKRARAVAAQGKDSDYRFPPISLLKEQVRASGPSNEEEHRRNAENLLRILGEFGVDVSLGEIHVGPVITRYEVVPAAGVRVEKISGLDKNIALGMRAQSVRILAPIPGKAAVGVEVPNQHPTPVGLREILESEDWNSARADLPIALGKDVSGKPLISDLTKMPHLLIAGATGSGKSVCVNAIIASILYSKSPRDVRLIMVDPKMVELKIFNVLPHMLIPVLTEPKKVPAALKWLLREMEQRYQIFAKSNVRNIVGFNNRRKGGKEEPAPVDPQAALAGLGIPPVDDIEIPDRLPYIVVLIDELADLMMIAPAEIETNIARLAQLARAAGIHLIIATQRPSVNVVTGIIKANLPSRIAFQMVSQIDSRTIIDTKGADNLIGRGDMLFTPPGTSHILRAQGAFVADEEIQGIVDFLRENNAPPVYAQSVQQQIDRTAEEDAEGEDGGGDDDDLGDDEALYSQALDVLKATRRASTSMLQRRLRIGYNRAARIMEIMEEKGLVGPENGSSPREILADLDKL
jgi:DNA segregation ATPase FtsK/SpoIIIE, S-DNA-T family